MVSAVEHNRATKILLGTAKTSWPSDGMQALKTMRERKTCVV
jgi:hypothetical protein